MHQDLLKLRSALTSHPLFNQINDLPALRLFMQTHVFAVWDFMSLLKRLQNSLTCTQVPWLPSEDAHAARLVNEIVLGEETDVLADGSYLSHYSLYLEAMSEVNADQSQIQELIALVAKGDAVHLALEKLGVPSFIANFVNFNIEIAQNAPIHHVAAVFLYGREELIADMFSAVIAQSTIDRRKTPRFFYYLERHIEVDGGSHGILAEQLLTRLCKGEHVLEQEALAVAKKALELRKALWDGVLVQIQQTLARIN